MSAESLIEWTDATWNPLLGCSKCSAGCQNCYAIKTAWRLQHNPHPAVAKAYAGLVAQRGDGSLNWTGRFNLLPERLRQPMQWARPRRIFVNSQSDLFHDDVPESFLDQVFAVMACCRRHTFQVLTKRPARMRAYVDSIWPLPNVWLGTSVENQKAADERVPALLATPAAVRFLSMEPLLGAVEPLLRCPRDHNNDGNCDHHPHGCPRIHWVIVGGESGQDARPMHPAWARSLRDQCVTAGVPFFFKQWGEWGRRGENGVTLDSVGSLDLMGKWINGGEFSTGFITGDEEHVVRVGKKAAGRLLDGREWNEMPEGSCA